jgi:dihydropteroate synthase
VTNHLINCGGYLLDFSKPQVMGILNLTPDSFFHKSRISGTSDLLHTAAQMLDAGAAILDIGGQSTRPGAGLIAAETEWERLKTPLQALQQHFPEAIISVDTFYGQVAQRAVESGAHIINDVSSGTMDPELWPTVARLQVPYVLNHIQGTPQTMQQNPVYEDVVGEVIHALSVKLQQLRALGLNDVIVDPGFGFGKTITHNYQLMAQLEHFKVLDAPLLVGVSRKGMIYKLLGVEAAEALNGTTALHMVALQKGAQLLRVHDVAPAVEAIKIFEALKNATC